MREEWAQAVRDKARKYWTAERTQHLTHGKNLLLKPAEAPVLLRALGLLHRDATMPRKERRKYFQINHMLAVLNPCMEELCQRFDTVHLIDAGCGRSYLTVLLAWAFENIYQHPVRILGVDRREKLIQECRRRTELARLDHVLKYVAADLSELDLTESWHESFGGEPEIHGVVALHACNTATDDAIVLGVDCGSHLIAVAPCCQSELANAVVARQKSGKHSSPLGPMWTTPHLRRHTGALMTDTMRMLLLQAVGWDSVAMEFVASSHTPKNTLIRAIRQKPQDGVDASPATLGEEALEEYRKLKSLTGGCGIALEEQLLSR